MPVIEKVFSRPPMALVALRSLFIPLRLPRFRLNIRTYTPIFTLGPYAFQIELFKPSKLNGTLYYLTPLLLIHNTGHDHHAHAPRRLN